MQHNPVMHFVSGGKKNASQYQIKHRSSWESSKTYIVSWFCIIGISITCFYRKLLDPGLSVSSRQSMFLNLLYKSLKADIVLRRVKAFVKRLLQVSCEQSPTFACGALFLVSEVMKAKPGLKILLQEGVRPCLGWY